jgi:lipopolysaccharide export system permease protein
MSSTDALNLSLHDDHGGQTILHADGGVGQADPGSGAIAMRRVSIVLWRNGVPTEFFVGQRAEWVVGTKNWRLIDGQHALLGNNPAVTHFGDVSTQEVNPVVSLDTPSQMAVLQREEGEVTTPQLRERIRVLRSGGNESEARKSEVELARRGALPFASLVFAMIGAPLGVSPRREGKGVGFALSVLITFCYWIGLQVFSIVSQGGSLPPGPAIAIPNIVCFTLALYLNRRVLRG